MRILTSGSAGTQPRLIRRSLQGGGGSGVGPATEKNYCFALPDLSAVAFGYGVTGWSFLPEFRRYFSFVLCFMVFSAFAADITRPNVILIMTDDQGWGQTGYYNHPRA